MKYFQALAMVIALFVPKLLMAGYFSVNESAITQAVATVSGAQVVAADPKRNYILIQNVGSQAVLANFGSAVSGAVGVSIAAGASFEPAKGFLDSLYIKSVSGSQTVIILEGR